MLTGYERGRFQIAAAGVVSFVGRAEQKLVSS
jgi:hypothetical protein